MTDDELAALRAIMRRYRKLEAVRAERDQEIAALVDKRVPREEIGRVVDLTREQIRRIVIAERKRRAESDNSAAE